MNKPRIKQMLRLVRDNSNAAGKVRKCLTKKIMKNARLGNSGIVLNRVKDLARILERKKDKLQPFACHGMAYVQKIILVDGTVLENTQVMFKAPIPDRKVLNEIFAAAGNLSEKIFAKTSADCNISKRKTPL